MNLNDALKYTTTEINAMLPKIAEGGAEAQAGHHHRLVAADAFSDAGREAEARLLRSEHPVYVRNGKVYRHRGTAADRHEFFTGYAGSAMYTGLLHPHTGEEIVPAHRGFTEDHLDAETLRKMRADSDHFFNSNYDLLSDPYEDGGRFWFGRQSDDAGFTPEHAFEEDDTEHWPKLQKASREAGPFSLDLTADGIKHFSGGDTRTPHQVFSDMFMGTGQVTGDLPLFKGRHSKQDSGWGQPEGLPE